MTCKILKFDIYFIIKHILCIIRRCIIYPMSYKTQRCINNKYNYNNCKLCNKRNRIHHYDKFNNENNRSIKKINNQIDIKKMLKCIFKIKEPIKIYKNVESKKSKKNDMIVSYDGLTSGSLPNNKYKTKLDNIESFIQTKNRGEFVNCYRKSPRETANMICFILQKYCENKEKYKEDIKWLLSFEYTRDEISIFNEVCKRNLITVASTIAAMFRYYFLVGINNKKISYYYVKTKNINLFQILEIIKKYKGKMTPIFLNVSSWLIGMDVFTNQMECPVCYDNTTKNLETKCKHSFCISCFNVHLETKNNCPMCRHTVINNSQFIEKAYDDFDIPINDRQINYDFDDISISDESVYYPGVFTNRVVYYSQLW